MDPYSGYDRPPQRGYSAGRRSASPDYSLGGMNAPPRGEYYDGGDRGGARRGRGAARGRRGRGGYGDRAAGFGAPGAGGGYDAGGYDRRPDHGPEPSFHRPPPFAPAQAQAQLRNDRALSPVRYEDRERRAPNPSAPRGPTENSLIEDRIAKERPCRTLFVRNIKYETDPNLIQERFDRCGAIRTFFNLIEKRGMVFITYYDLRAAITAKESLQGSEVANRPIDVHFSLPRDADLERPCTREKGQGTLLMLVRGAREPTKEREIHLRFSTFGEIKAIFPHARRRDEWYIEFFDSRACERAHDAMQEKTMSGGVIEIEFVWDILPPTPMPPVVPQQTGSGPPPPLYPGSTYNPPAPPGLRPPPSFSDTQPAFTNNYRQTPQSNETEDRLAQAQKVQALLSALANPQPPPPPPPPPHHVPPPNVGFNSGPKPPMPYIPPPNAYGGAPTFNAGPGPSAGGYGPPPTSDRTYGLPPPGALSPQRGSFDRPPYGGGGGGYSGSPPRTDAYAGPSSDYRGQNPNPYTAPPPPPQSYQPPPARPPAFDPRQPTSSSSSASSDPRLGNGPHSAFSPPPSAASASGATPALPPALVALLEQTKQTQQGASSAVPVPPPQRYDNGQAQAQGQERGGAEGGAPAQVQALLALLAQQQQQRS